MLDLDLILDPHNKNGVEQQKGTHNQDNESKWYATEVDWLSNSKSSSQSDDRHSEEKSVTAKVK